MHDDGAEIIVPGIPARIADPVDPGHKHWRIPGPAWTEMDREIVLRHALPRQ
jgi:hypothetical protein